MEEEPASPATRLFHTSKLNCFIIAIIGCKTKIDIEIIKKGGFSNLLKIPRFSSVMIKNDTHGMRWTHVTTNFEDHVFYPNIDDDMNSGDTFVDHYIDGLTTKQMDLDKPLWEAHILNVKTSDANSLIIFRIHHSLGDGISLISALLACTRKTSDPESLPTIPIKKPKETNSGNLIRQSLYMIWTIIMMMIHTLVDVIILLATLLFLKDTKTPIKGRHGIERSQKRILHRTVSLNDIKLIKTAMNTTVNDVILGVTEAGLSRYLNRQYENSNIERKKASEETNNLPKNIKFRATMIFNIRPSSTLQVFDDMLKKNSKAKWGNKIGICLHPLRIDLRDDPLFHIREAQVISNRNKLSLGPIFSYFISYFMTLLLGSKFAAAIMYKICYNTTICFSNVVGPKEEISVDGHPISYIAPSVHGLPYALIIHYQSYANKMTIVLTYDQCLISNPHQLCDDLEESLNIMKHTVIKKELAKKNES